MLLQKIMELISEYEKALNAIQKCMDINDVNWDVVNTISKNFIYKAQKEFILNHQDDIKNLAIKMIEKELDEVHTWKL